MCVLLTFLDKSKIAPAVTAFFSVVIFGFIIVRYSKAGEFLQGISNSVGIDEELSFMFKVACIGLATEIAAGVCKDLGENGIAGKIELCGKAEMIIMCLPMIEGILSTLR